MTASGTSLAIRRTGRLTGLNPLCYADQATGEVLQRMFDHLVVTDASGATRSGSIVAEVRTAAGRGRLRHDITLRPRRFHDGTPVTGDDVAYSYRAVLDDGNPKGSSIRAAGGDLTITGIDDRVVVEYDQDGMGLAALAWHPIVPRRYYGTDGRATRTDAPPVGSGPYRFDGAAADLGSIRLRRVRAAAPHPDTIVVATVSDEQEALHTVAGGAGDVATGISPASVHDAPAPGSDGAPVVASHQYGATTYLALNAAAPALRDPVVRRALLGCLDTRSLTSAVYGDHAIAATSFVHRDSPWHETVPPWGGEGDQGAVGTLETIGADRRIDEFTLLVARGDAGRRRVADGVAAEWRGHGVPATVTEVPVAELYGRHIGPRTYAAALLAIVSSPAPTFLASLFHSGGGSGTNRFGVADTEVDAALDGLSPSAEASPGEQRRHVADLLDRVAAAHVVRPVAHPAEVTVSRTGVRLPSLRGSFGNRFADLADWTVRADT